MTSPDLIRELQATRPEAPASLRGRVREIAAQEGVKPSRFRLHVPLRRRVLIAVPFATALALAIGTAGVVGLVGSGDGGSLTAERALAPRTPEASENAPSPPHTTSTLESAPLGATDKTLSGITVAPTPGRAERVSATLTLKVADSDGVSQAAQEALDLTRSLGGHVVSASVASGENASATLTLRIPVAKTQDAIVRLSSLGTIVSQQVSIDDLQETLDALLRRARSVRSQIVRITARLDSESLDPETRAALELRRRTLRTELRTLRQNVASTNAEARFATIQVSVVTPDALGTVPTPSRLDRTLDRAFEVLVWEGVIALAAMLVAAPFAILGLAAWLARHVYRKREDERLLAAS